MAFGDRFRGRPSQPSDDSHDSFDKFAYWEPNEDLTRKIKAQAKAAGRNDIPVVENHVVENPPGIGYILALTQEAMLNLNGEANRLLRPKSLKVAELVQGLRADPTSLSPNADRSRAAYISMLKQLQSLEMEIVQLENALRSRLIKAHAHGNGLIEKFVIVLTAHHSHPSILQRRWRSPSAHDPEEFMDFGQRPVLDEIRVFEDSHPHLFGTNSE